MTVDADRIEPVLYDSLRDHLVMAHGFGQARADQEHIATLVVWHDNEHQDGEPGHVHKSLLVRLMLNDTGEIKERAWSGTDRGISVQGQVYVDAWQVDALDQALALVPDLMQALDRARLRGKDVEVVVRDA